jgi:intracellular sulfur oxidation DsrE/DsrF family protein
VKTEGDRKIETQKDDKVSVEVVSSWNSCSLVRRKPETASTMVILVENCDPNACNISMCSYNGILHSFFVQNNSGIPPALRTQSSS